MTVPLRMSCTLPCLNRIPFHWQKKFPFRIVSLDPSLTWASLLKVATTVKGEAAEKVGYSQYVTSYVKLLRI